MARVKTYAGERNKRRQPKRAPAPNRDRLTVGVDLGDQHFIFRFGIFAFSIVAQCSLTSIQLFALNSSICRRGKSVNSRMSPAFAATRTSRRPTVHTGAGRESCHCRSTCRPLDRASRIPNRCVPDSWDAAGIGPLRVSFGGECSPLLLLSPSRLRLSRSSRS
jgi:hypothetical protein